MDKNEDEELKRIRDLEKKRIRDLRKLEKFMSSSGIEPPRNKPPFGSGSTSTPDEEPETVTLNQLIAEWCEARFKDPKSASDALRKGEDLREAAACLFWYCYTARLDKFGGEANSLLNKMKQKDLKAAFKASERLNKISTQLNTIANTFTLADVKYPKGQDPYVEVLAGVALIILMFKDKPWDVKTRLLIKRIFDLADIPVGEDGYKLAIGIQSIEIKKANDNAYSVSGNVTNFLAMRACVIAWDSFVTVSLIDKEYEKYFITAVKIIDFCWLTLSDSIEENKIDREIEIDVSVRLPYSRVSSLDMEYFKKIIDIWQRAKNGLSELADWKYMQTLLEELLSIFKGRYCPTDKPDDRGITWDWSSFEIEELETRIQVEIYICQHEIEKLARGS